MARSAAGRETFGEYVNRWYAVQDLAASTMENYWRHIESHILPAFENHAPSTDPARPSPSA